MFSYRNKKTLVMKNIFSFFLFLLIFVNCYSQEFKSRKEKDKDKPVLFHNESSSFSARQEFFEILFMVQVNDTVTLPISSTTEFTGVVKTINKNNISRSISLKSNDENNITLIVSAILRNNQVFYKGFLFSADYKDILILETDVLSKKHMWYKKEFSDIIPD